MKKTAKKSRDQKAKSTQLRTCAVRALTGSALQQAQGGSDGPPPSNFGSDPIC